MTIVPVNCISTLNTITVGMTGSAFSTASLRSISLLTSMALEVADAKIDVLLNINAKEDEISSAVHKKRINKFFLLLLCGVLLFLCLTFRSSFDIFNSFHYLV